MSRRKRRPGGFVLVIVMIMVLTTAAFAAVHQRELTSALRVEQARMISEQSARGPKAVLAVAIERLHTGYPVSDGGSIEYRYEHTLDSITTTYRVSYSLSGTTWTVDATPDDSAVSLPMLPANL